MAHSKLTGIKLLTGTTTIYTYSNNRPSLTISSTGSSVGGAVGLNY